MKKKKLLTFILLIALIFILITLSFVIDPTKIVDVLGTKNGYILTFFVSFFGGFSAGGSISFITLLITLVSGGMNPIYLGVVSGISLAIGDLIMYYTGQKGRDLISGKWDKRITAITKFLDKKKWLRKFIPIFSYLYISFAPLPNDILLLSLAAIKYPIKKIAVIIILGDLTFPLMITILVANGSNLIS